MTPDDINVYKIAGYIPVSRDILIDKAMSKAHVGRLGIFAYAAGMWGGTTHIAIALRRKTAIRRLRSVLAMEASQ